MMTLLFGFLLLFQQSAPLKTNATGHFLIRHDKTIPAKAVRDLAAALEEELGRAQKALGITVARKIPVVLYTTELRYKSESRSLAFDDGDMKGGTIHLSYPFLKKDREAWGPLVARVVAKAVVTEVVFCPPWLADAYALHAGAQTKRFGDPAQVAIASFGDLFEEYNRAERPREVKEAYAKLGFTIDFLMERFGEQKVRELFPLFRSGRSVEDVFTQVFQEPVGATEQAWVAALRASSKK
jgi:hypothetical protein